MLAVIILLSMLSASRCYGDTTEEQNSPVTHFLADLWLEGGDVIKIIWRDCSKQLSEVKGTLTYREYFPEFLRCMKRKTLRALDRSLRMDVVPILDGVNLVRYEMVDKSGNILTYENETGAWSDRELEEVDWRTLALKRLAGVLRTHVIKFDFDDGKASEKVEYRGKRRHHMMTMMMFGIVSIGMVLVPMGFQFLAVLGGKALLLAKMALILASIQSLKKVENNVDAYNERGKIHASPLNYGLYHNYPPPYYEKRSQHERPHPSSALRETSPQLMAEDDLFTNIQDGNYKVDKIQIASDEAEAAISKDLHIYKLEYPKALKFENDADLHPVYFASPDTPASAFNSIDAPNPLIDLTTTPGEVQADYALEMPYNGFRFQTPTSVVSA